MHSSMEILRPEGFAQQIGRLEIYMNSLNPMILTPSDAFGQQSAPDSLASTFWFDVSTYAIDCTCIDVAQRNGIQLLVTSDLHNADRHAVS